MPWLVLLLKLDTNLAITHTTPRATQIGGRRSREGGRGAKKEFRRRKRTTIRPCICQEDVWTWIREEESPWRKWRNRREGEQILPHSCTLIESVAELR